MSQVDWLMEYSTGLQSHESCVSIVISGDIDAVVIHLFAMSYLWPRTEDGSFKNDVYVLLRKPNHRYDINNITKIISHFTSEQYIAIKLAVVLSLGGNDFLPKFHSISHSTQLDMFLKEILLRENLVTIAVDSGKVTSVNFNTEIYSEFIKDLYCPKMYDPSKLTFEEVRQMSIQLPTSKSKEVVRNAQLWMSPKCVIERLSRNVSCLINYYVSRETLCIASRLSD